jgi:hypothetical protein
MSHPNITETVQSLNANGISVRIRHIRPKHTVVVPVEIKDANGNTIPNLFTKTRVPKDKGGYTTVNLTKLIDGHSVTVESKSICNRSEVFNGAQGARMALGRAIHELSQVISLPE